MDESKHMNDQSDLTDLVVAGAGDGGGGGGGVTSRGFSFRTRRSDQRAIFRAARGLVV